MNHVPPAAISDRLLDWYDRHARTLPWRVGPKQRARGVCPDPYRVWLSEIMLQQTTVTAVKPYFETFVATWPDVIALAAAPRESVMKAWAGLGYYSRARNLHACAQRVARDFDGRFPTTMKELKTLPGIGDYTAAAIAAIAYDQPAAVVDGNVERVLTRRFAIDTPLPAAKKIVRTLQQDLTPQQRAGDYAQAMMDLGATICTPKRPACVLCPLANDCIARARGEQMGFPVKPAKAARPTRYGAAFVAARPDGAILLRKRPDKGLLGGMTEVPGTGWGDTPQESPLAFAPLPGDWQTAADPVVHVFTHFRLELTVLRVTTDVRDAPQGCWWASAETLPGEALPSVMKKAIESAVPGATKAKRARKSAA